MSTIKSVSALSWKFKFWVLNFLLKTLQLFFLLYDFVVPGCTAVAPGNFQLFRHCSGMFQCFVVPCSGVPGFIVCQYIWRFPNLH